MKYNKHNFKEIEEKFINEQGLPFANVLSEEEIEKALEKENIEYRKRILTPTITLWAFLSQVFDGDSSGRKGVERVLAFFICKGTRIFSLTESALCQAKKKLKETFLKLLTYEISQNLTDSLKPEQLWYGHRVKVMDSSGILMADTPKNQREYPQYYNCKPGCGYPIVRIAVLFCLITGMVLEMYLAPMQTSERELFRRFYKNLSAGEVVLGDRGCCSFADIVMLTDKGVFCVFRICARKKVNFNEGIRIGDKDHLVQWHKPNRPQTSAWSAVEYSLLPSTIWVREIEYNVEIPGFRTKKVMLVTTLFEAHIYPKEAFIQLYFRRWEAEINLRHLKTTMKMEFINAKTPHMVRNSIWVHLLAYNLIRSVMWQAGMLHNVSPLRISFKGTIDRINVYLPQLALADSDRKQILYQILLWNISQDLLPIRRGRIYARCIKPRKNYPRISCSRAEYRARVLSSITYALT